MYWAHKRGQIPCNLEARLEKPFEAGSFYRDQIHICTVRCTKVMVLTLSQSLAADIWKCSEDIFSLFQWNMWFLKKYIKARWLMAVSLDWIDCTVLKWSVITVEWYITQLQYSTVQRLCESSVLSGGWRVRCYRDCLDIFWGRISSASLWPPRSSSTTTTSDSTISSSIL